MWEYDIISLPPGHDAENLVRDYGKGGWELVSVIFIPPHDYKEGRMTTQIMSSVRHYFRRPLSS